MIPKFSRLFTKNRHFNHVIYIGLLLLLAVCLTWKIICDGIIFETPDLHIHVNWLQHFSREFDDGAIYPRWLAGTNYGYGSPTFVFYPPLVYFIGSVLIKLGLDTQSAIVSLFVIPISLTGINFYLYGIYRWSKFSAFVGAVIYVLAPYISYNITYRGALAETWAIALAPLGILAIDRATDSSKNLLWVSLFFLVISLVHTPSLLIYAAYLFIYIAALFRKSYIKKTILIFIHAIIGFGIAAIYLIPAIFEQPLVNMSIMKGVAGGWSEHIVRLASDNSIPGHILSFYRYSSVFLFVLFAFCFYLECKLQKKLRERTSIPWFLLGMITLFMMCSLSSPIWQASSLLQMLQFPWRLMGVMSLSIAGLMTVTVSNLIELQDKGQHIVPKLIGFCLIIAMILLNVKYCYSLWKRYDGFYNPGELVETKNGKTPWKSISHDRIKTALSEHFSEKLSDVPEHRPRGSSEPLPNQPRVSVLEGTAEILTLQWQNRRRSFEISVPAKSSRIKLRTYDYPAWQLRINENIAEIKPAPDGTITFELGQGVSQVELIYTSTQSEKIAITISGLSLVVLTILSVPNKFIRYP